jgi:arylsulfatase A-like enzyme
MPTSLRTLRILLSIVIFLTAGCRNYREDKPNILFILSDDHSYSAVHALGNADVRTPVIDRLVAQGLTFTHTYNMGAWHGAVCVASRTMLNTGRSVWRARQLEPDLAALAEQRRFWSQLMEDAGYETYFSGKWHVSFPPDCLFNHIAHVRPGMPADRPEGYNRPKEGQADVWSPSDTAWGGFWEGGQHWSEVLADDAVRFIQQAATRDQPFFMYLAFNAPHDPRQAPEEYVDLYPTDQLELPDNFLPLYPYRGEMGAGEDLRDERLAPFPRTDHAIRVHLREYYAIISHMDTQIGRILDALEVSGKKDNTIIIYTSDHGLACGQHGLMGKQNMYDHSLRPPLIVCGPGVRKNEAVSQPVYLQDIMATCLDLAGVAKPAHVEFNSLLPYLRHRADNNEQPHLYGAYTDKQRMIRSGRYKLILYPEVPAARLFDLQADPLEIKDLSDQAEYANTAKVIFGQLQELQRKMDDTLRLEGRYPLLQE